MAYISKQQVKDLIQNAPAGVTPSAIIDSLVRQGNTLEGYNDGQPTSAARHVAPTSNPDGSPVQPADTTTAPEKKTVGGFVGNVFKSGAHLVGGIADAAVNVFNPDMEKNTVANLAKTAVGGVEKLIPGEQSQEKNFDALTNFFKERYGSVDALKETLYNDPVGVATDLATILTAGGGAVTKLGKLADIQKAAEIGGAISKAGDVVNPINAMGKAAGAAGDAMAARSAGKASTVQEDVAQAAARRGVDLNAGALTGDKTVQSVEAFASKGYFGGNLRAKVQAATDKLNQLADEIVGKTSSAGDPVQAGQAAARGFSEYKKAFQSTKDALYEEAQLPSISIAPADIADSTKFLDTIVQKKIGASRIMGGTAKDYQFFKDMQDSLRNPASLTAEDLKNFIQETNDKLFSSTDPIITGNKGLLQKLVAKMDSDLQGIVKTKAPETYSALQEADNFYKEGISKINSSYGEILQNSASQPDKIVGAILNNGTSIEDIPKIYEVIGKENVSAVQGAFLKKFFEDSKSMAREGEPFTAGGIARKIRQFGGDAKLKAVLTPEQYGVVSDLKTLSRALENSQKILNGSQTAFLQRLALEGAAGLINPGFAIKAGAADLAFSKFVGSKAGQKFLSSGGFKLNGALGQKLRDAATKYKKAGLGAAQADRNNQAQKDNQD